MSSFARAIAITWSVLPIAAGIAAQQVVNLPAADKALEPQMQNVYKVGRIEGPTWELFGARVETQFDGAGNLYVFDLDNKRVVMVSPTGSLVRTIGKAGDGPGEFRTPSSFSVMRDGTVIVADLGQRSFLVFNPQGVYTRSVQFGSGSSTTLGRLLADPRGGALISAGRQAVMVQSSQSSGGSIGAPTVPSARPVIRYPLDGSASKQIFAAWEPPAPPPVQTSSAGGGARAFSFNAGRAFEPTVLSGIMPDGGIVLSDSSAYGLKVITPEGALQRILRRPIRPQQVNAQIQRQEKDRRLAELAAGGGPRVQIMTSSGGGAPSPVPQADIQEMQRRSLDNLQFYPEVPVVTGLGVGWTGKIWLERRGSTLTAPGPVDVLTATGDYLGTLAAAGASSRLPSAFGPEGLVAFVEKDALEVVSVSVRRLPMSLR